MDESTILEKIIEEDGSCCWAVTAICNRCPLGRLARNDRGGFMSCVEAINIDGLSADEADQKYKESAIRKLADLSMDKIIEAD